MMYKKKKVEKRKNSKETEENKINAWEVIKGNLATINLTCDIIRKTLKTSQINTEIIKNHYNSQATNYNELLYNTNAILKNTGDNLKKATNIIDSVKREYGLESASIFPGLPLKLPN